MSGMSSLQWSRRHWLVMRNIDYNRWRPNRLENVVACLNRVEANRLWPITNATWTSATMAIFRFQYLLISHDSCKTDFVDGCATWRGRAEISSMPAREQCWVHPRGEPRPLVESIGLPRHPTMRMVTVTTYIVIRLDKYNDGVLSQLFSCSMGQNSANFLWKKRSTARVSNPSVIDSKHECFR